MTFPTANMRFCHIPFGLFTIGRDLDPPLEQGLDRSRHSGVQFQIFTGIGSADARDRTGSAQVGRPALAGNLEQAAFFNVSAAEVITVEIWAFDAGRSFHEKNYRPI